MRERALWDRVEIESDEAWLTTATTRIALDHLRSARVRREQDPGRWLPEPLVADERLEPAELAETLSLAFLVLLATLSSVERAVLAPGVVFFGDGGGTTLAVPEPVHGRDRVAGVLLSFAAGPGARPRREVRRRQRPARLRRAHDRRPRPAVMSLDIAGGAVQTVRSIVDPDKLAHLGEPADIAELRRERSG